MSSSTKVTSPLLVARKAKKYGHVSLAYALSAVNPKSTLTGAEIASLEGPDADPKVVAKVIKSMEVLPVKPGRFWDILEGRIAPPTDALKVFAPVKGKSASPAVAVKSDLL